MRNSHRSYVLESEAEFDRLERQSRTAAYDYKSELEDMIGSTTFGYGQRILDAGCGSGIVSRHLARLYPDASIHGCDFSELRIAQTRAASKEIPNLSIDHCSLDSLRYPDNHFDLIVCRFVIQHLRPRSRARTLEQFYRCLKPGGTLHLIETDGLFFNITPAPKELLKQLETWRRDDSVDMFASRMLPSLLLQAGYRDVDWDIRAVNFKGDSLETEIGLYRERIDQALPLFVRIFGTKAKAQRFKANYLRALSRPGAVVFHNKFLISARKPEPRPPKLGLVRA